MRRMADLLNAATGWIDRLVQLALIGMAGSILLLLMLQVVMRYFIQTPLIWVEELASYVFGFLVLWGASCYVRYQRHVKVDTLANLLPTGGQFALGLLINLLIVYFGYLLATSGHRLAILGAADLSPSGTFNMFWPRLALVSGGVLLSLQGANNAIQLLARPKTLGSALQEGS